MESEHGNYVIVNLFTLLSSLIENCCIYMKNKVYITTWVMILLIGILILLYPTLSDYWNSLHQSQIVSSYQYSVKNLTKEQNKKILAEARLYNQSLRKGVTPSLNLTDNEIKKYNDSLNITSTGVMGYVEIPKLETTMPIYHGTDEAVLQIAIGHIPGTSLPVGGKGTHTVISGHRGLPSAKLFTNIDRLMSGDIFRIHVLDKIITYKVDQKLTVLPENISSLSIEPDKDYCTLVTCTPYGVNTHRLLVRGHRIPNKSKKKNNPVEPKYSLNKSTIAIAVSVLILGIIITVIVLIVRKRKNF